MTGEVVTWGARKKKVGDTTANHAAYRRVRAHLETTCGGQWQTWATHRKERNGSGRDKRTAGQKWVGGARCETRGSGGG
eukprot:1437961-Prymnesium_polylepis.1